MLKSSLVCLRTSLFLLLVLSLNLQAQYTAQINTPSPTIPFGTQPAYPGTETLPTNALQSDATAAYTAWCTNYITSCGGTPAQYRVNFDTPSETVSEGIGYGMLLAAYAGDKTLFDGLWSYYRANMNARGLMNWHINGCSGTLGSNGATDADEDAAMALIIAEYQWPAINTPYDYKTEANNLVTNINKCQLDKLQTPANQISNGDGWINCGSTATTCRNPSYMAPAYYKVFGTSPYITSAQPTTAWSNVVNSSYTLLNANVNATSGLVSNWCDQNGTPNTCNGPLDYGYDACRNPWRMAVDVAWYGDTRAKAICNKIAGLITTRGVNNLGELALNGTGAVISNSSSFSSTFAAGVIGADISYQATINGMYTKNVATTDALPKYFGNTLRVLSLFLATRNFWNPMNVVTGPTCATPNMTPSSGSLCGLTFPSPGLVLNSGLSAATGRTFKWLKNGSTITGANSSTFTITSAGTGAGVYKVIVDSTNGCSNSDTTVIFASIPGVNLGVNQNLCTPGYLTLNASVSGTGITYQWATTTALGTGAFAKLSDIASATGMTLSNVRTRGLYQVKVSAAGCSTVMDTISISSNLPTPVDACINTTGSATLSIANPGLGAGPYNWYTSETGNVLAAGASTNVTSYTTPSIGSTTTYWVQDMSAASATVGPTTYLNGTQQWGVSAGNKLVFNATSSFTLNSVSIPFIIYSGSSGSVTLAVQNSAGTVLTTATSLSTNAAAGSVVMLDFTFTGFNIPSGTGLQMVITSIGTINGNPLWNDNVAVSYPYNSTPSSIVSITGAVGGNGNPEYMYFYNWKISTGSACGRLPVIAKVGGCSVVVLGLNFMDFKATQDKENVLLEWNTSFESAGSNYQIERSYDGIHFEAIHTIASQGSYYRIQGYSFYDSPDLNESEVYYRIVSMEGNKGQVVSPIVKVNLQGTFDYKIYPNPLVGNELNVELSIKSNSNKYILEISDNLGRVVYSEKLDQDISSVKITFEKELVSGIYYVSIKNSSEQIHQKLIVY